MAIALTQAGTQRLRLTTNHNHGSAATAYTCGYWVKLVGSTLMTGDDISNHNGLHRHRGGTSNVAQERIWTNPTGVLNINSTTSFSADTWHFVVVTHDSASGTRLYFDGTEEAFTARTEPMATIAATVEYLGDAVPNWDVGDEVRIGGDFRIVGKALSGVEVAALYANRSGGGGTAKPQDHIGTGVTVRCSPFDQTTGTVTNGDTGLADLGDVGNPWITNTGTPSWVNDNPGHNWSEPDVEENAPDYVVTQELASTWYGDCRILQLADSFGNTVIGGRTLPMGYFLIDPDFRLTAYAGGHVVGAANGIIKAQSSATGTTYEIQSSDYEVENGSGNYFGLPVNILGIYCDGALTLNGGTRLTQYLMRNGLLGTYGVRLWINSGDRLKARLILLAANAGANQLMDIQVKDGGSPSAITLDLSVDGCRPRYMDGDDPEVDPGRAIIDGAINASFPDLELTNSSEVFTFDVLRGVSTPVGTNKFIQLGGVVGYLVDDNGDRIPGGYFTSLDGSSWSYVGFYGNTAATAGTQKTFDRTQVRPWLDVTTLDPDQRVIIVQNLADENNTEANHLTKIQALVTEGDAWCDGITTEPPLYLFIVQFAHEITGDPAEEQANQIAKAKACYTASQSNSRINYVSLYQMMDETYPTTDAKSGLTGGQAAYTAWAEARGWDAYTNGVITPEDVSDNLLDDPNALHLDGQTEAMAVATLLRTAIRSGLAVSSSPVGSAKQLGAAHRGRRF